MVFSPKAKQVSLAASASLLPSNLSVLNTSSAARAFYYIHKSVLTTAMRQLALHLHCQFLLCSALFLLLLLLLTTMPPSPLARSVQQCCSVADHSGR